MPMSERPLWTCPRCGHRFVTANIWHSCTSIALDDAFAGGSLGVREAFDGFVALIARCGEIEVIAQKSRIVIQARVRFSGAVVRTTYLDASLWLRRRAEHPPAEPPRA